jgi:hypothetical protein
VTWIQPSLPLSKDKRYKSVEYLKDQKSMTIWKGLWIALTRQVAIDPFSISVSQQVQTVLFFIFSVFDSVSDFL